jgi:type IV secretory pathway TraG/TraD family ATPase VirD4
MALFVYDLKYDDLTRLTYNTLEEIKKKQTPGHTHPISPIFYSVNFDDLSRSHRCNPLDPATLDDIADATDAAKTILYALNKNWINKQGDFFISSAISFFTANIWFLRQIEGGHYCTLAHLIELIQTDYPKLFSILQSFPDIQTLIGSFVSAFTNNVMEQLQGQVDSARIALSSLASPSLYYLLSANDFTLDINLPNAPKVVCIGSNPQKQLIYGAIISLYVSRMIKLVNKKGGVPCHLFFDEFSSFYASGMDLTLATARSNKVAITIGIQDLSQLRKEYGRDQADALFNLPGNLICSQVSGDSARLVSERFGKILQEKSTYSTNSRDTSISQSQHLDLAVPASKIATLSSGEFVGITADSPVQKITLKAFHAQILIDHKAIAIEEAAWQPIPEVRPVTREQVEDNFHQIKKDVRQLIDDRLAYMLQTPGLARHIVKKPDGNNRRRQSPT